MQTERVTILMSPERKAQVATKAAARGVSVGAYLRQKIENDDDEMTPDQEAELEELLRQANVAIPEMATMLDDMIATLRETNRQIEETLREAGIRS